MAKIALVCVRNPQRLPELKERMQGFLAALQPDNFQARLEVRTDSSMALGLYEVLHSSSAGLSAYVGWLQKPSWDDPVGSFGMFCAHPDRIELRADAVASRTIWIAHDNETFVASTSQRAIPWFLGGFEPNEEAVGWMISCGSLGYGNSWDRRAKPLGPYGTAVFDRTRWALRVSEPSITLTTVKASAKEFRKRIEAVVQEACSASFDNWAICLSGGRDSRNILQRIPDRSGLQAISWGAPGALDQPVSDAAIARRLTEKYGLKHQFFSTQMGSAEQFLERFVLAGEGRVDHIIGYTDGFELWRQIALSGVAGVIRGETILGYKAVQGPNDAGPAAGMVTLKRLGVPGLDHLTTTVPEHLACVAGESGQDYCHRLVHAFRQPVVMAALTELKATYTEVANPLVSHPVTEVARSMPSNLRDNKWLFDSMAGQSVPFAKDRGLHSAEVILNEPRVKAQLLDTLHSQATRERFSATFIRHVSEGMARGKTRKPSLVSRVIRKLRPQRHRMPLLSASGYHFALRAYLVERMHRRLSEDGVMSEQRLIVNA